jgi:putative transposase
MITAHHISARRADSILCAAMTFKLVESAQACWSAVNAPGLAALVRASARFERGILAGPAERDAA